MALNIEELIGRHFKLKHLIWSNTAKNKGINNMPGVDGSPSQIKVIENLRGLEIEFIYKWNLGDLLIFDRTHLHCSSSNIKNKKIGLTTFTKK